MSPPLIGITTYGRNDENHFSLPVEYVYAVRRAGGIVTLMPPGEPHIEDWLECVDGLIVSGGVDVEPSLYGLEDTSMIEKTNAIRDHDEVAALHAAIETELPTLAVCRGMQLLNVALGGGLIPHLPHANPDGIEHRGIDPQKPEAKPFAIPHYITLDPGSRISALMGVSRIHAMSWHHQAIDQVGDGLVVVGHAEDQVVEAMEMPDHPFMLAVQWHPELSAAEQPEQQRLFEGLVRAAMGE